MIVPAGAVGYAMSDVRWVGVVAAAVVGTVIAILTMGMAGRVRASRRWVQTSGTVVVSKVQPRMLGDEPGGPVANDRIVEYEYRVGDRLYTGNRIGIDDDTGATASGEALEGYPPGATVTVFYDPADPERAALERAMPRDMGRGVVILLFALVIVPVTLALVFTVGARRLAPLLPNPQNARLVLVLAGGSALLILLGAILQRQAAKARGWPQTEALVLSSRIRERRKTRGGNGPPRWFELNVVYAYDVDGRRYAGHRATTGNWYGGSPGRLLREDREKHRQGSMVPVYFNPKDPTESRLDKRPEGALIFWFFACVFLVAAVVAGWRRV